MSGANKQEIFLFNRKQHVIQSENVFERGLVEFCYQTKIGVFLSDLVLKRRFISKLYGLWSKLPVTRRKIASFIEKNDINTNEIASPLESFRSYNDFFIRKLKPEARPVEKNPQILISPADSRLLVYNLNKDKIIPVKGRGYKISELLGTGKFDADYENGTCLVFRLAPGDYHRFGYIDHGEQDCVWEKGRALHSVNPLALNSGLPVFKENFREAVVLDTNNFGQVLHVDVGAMIVGRIVQHHRDAHIFSKGEEKGYFEFGGSSIVLLFKPDTVKIDHDIHEYSSRGIETLVKYGEAIGKVPSSTPTYQG